MRLHRFIAQCGVTSRRKAEEAILAGRVTVNGEPVVTVGTSIDPAEDVVTYDGQVLAIPRPAYYLFHKPKSVVTTLSDPQGRRTVADFFPLGVVGLKPIGRLDYATDGLMLVTNDGDFAANVSHPSHGVEKEYEANVRGVPSTATLQRLQRGIVIEGRRTSPAEASVMRIGPKEGTSTVLLTLREGRKHQVRLMLASVGHPVNSLRRVRIGHLRLAGLRPGEMRKLGRQEVDMLLAHSGKTKRDAAK